MNELSRTFQAWTFNSEIEVPDKINEMLIDGEEAICAYKTIRDIAVFTNKRLIVRDVQGITGKKAETYSVPFKSINMYSTENAGHIDINSEIELWTKAGNIKINLKRGIDLLRIEKIIAEAIL